MKNLFLLLALLIVGTAVAQVKRIKGTGYLLVQARDASKPFTKISVQQGITLYLKQGKEFGITIEADDNIISHVKTEIKNGQLNVFLDPNVIIRSFTAMNVSVATPEITGLDVSSAARLIGSSPLRVDKLELSASGTAVVKLEVEGKELDVEASNAAKLELKGAVDRLELEMSSSATLKAWDLRAADCEAEISNAAKAEVYVSGTLGVQLSSAGLLVYDGNPRITKQDVSGRGALAKKK
ncbi:MULTISPECIES: head GIN domain-containing protein [Butyricimonas]|uniref:head GIN domain-containing protein n=1 Tax=Butyricimonas TaxID=574697 RepID=UPI00039DE6FA|nr:MULTISPECIES: head GIN domain-containing protein [Butyricimonas]